MPENTHVEELIPAYALNCLDDDETDRVAEHLTGCPACRAELDTYRQVIGELALTAPGVAPPPDLHDRLVEAVAPSIEPWWHPLVNLLRRPVPAWSLAGALALILLLGFWLANLSAPASPSLPTMQTVALPGTEAVPGAQGLLVIGSDGNEGALVVEHLPALNADHQFQLWLIDKNGQRTSGAIFSVDADGYGAVMVSSPRPLTGYTAFGVTVEPAGGSPGPTGRKVLGGTF
jgi:anti-sigma-K factor RskA